MLPPGSIKIIGRDGSVIPYPKPTDDYDDTLNWSIRRKTVHYLIILIYVGVTFAFLDIQPISNEMLQRELSMTAREITVAIALQHVGLALTGIGLIPLSYRYGRRPLYLFSILLQLIACIWLAVLRSKWEYYTASWLSGAGAAVSQVLVPMTITDLFFTHQFATSYGIFMFAQGSGAFLGPFLASVLMKHLEPEKRWLPWSMVVTFASTAILLLIGAEESTFVPKVWNEDDACRNFKSLSEHIPHNDTVMDADNAFDLVNLNRMSSGRLQLDLPPEPRPWRKRFGLLTKTGRPIKERFLSCFVILVTFPGVAYAALTYGFIMAWLFIFVHSISAELTKPPYALDDEMIGIFSLGPLLGHFIGTMVVSRISDHWIVWRARANLGVYEPEMRLWFALGAGLFVFAGMAMFGLSISKGVSIPTLMASYTIFSLGFGICLEVCLTYITDCYHNMIGDAMVGVALVRNALAALIWFTVVSWMESMGVRSVFIIAAMTSIPVLLTPIPLLIWGRRGRAATAAKYRHYSLAAIPPVVLDAILSQKESDISNQ